MMRKFVKRALAVLAAICILPLIILTRLETIIFGKKANRFYIACVELLSLVPSIIGNYLRKAFYWTVCQDVSPDAHFLFGCMLAHRENIIRAGVVIGAHTYIGFADIGENVMFGARVSIISGKYQHGRPSERAQGGTITEENVVIVIGANTWIGQDVSILANIGTNCTVAAGSVVFKDVPDNTTVMGNPARKVSLESM
jgi:virginiamycin A acetyltransferase